MKKNQEKMMAPYPTYEDMMTFAKDFAKNTSDLVKYEIIGKSEKGRPMGLLVITDPAV